MSKGTATLIVMVAGGVLIGLALLGESGSRYRAVWASSIFTTLLAIFADLAPSIVGPFALLIVIAAATKKPGVIGKFITGSTPAGVAAKPIAGRNTSGATG